MHEFLLEFNMYLTKTFSLWYFQRKLDFIQSLNHREVNLTVQIMSGYYIVPNHSTTLPEML